jgi:hypothetical protein
MSDLAQPLQIPQQLPFLEALGWQTTNIQQFSPQEILTRYERGWQYRGVLVDLDVEELSFVRELSQRYGSWLTAMFEWVQHQQILAVLNHLNAEWLRQHCAYFGGGTLLALKYDEYRLSQAIDFICPLGEDYRLRRREIGDRGYDTLFAPNTNIQFRRRTLFRLV